jgi:signal transduction histidine kinase
VYWQFWNSFWKHYSDAPRTGIAAPPESARDISRYLTQYGTQILATFSTSGECTSLSDNFSRITGHAVGSHIGRHFYDLVHGDARDALQALLAGPLTEAQSFRCRLQHADRKWYWYGFDMYPQDGQIVCIIDNIHAAMQAQNTLQRARLEAELALRARSEFLANMSHELRTPLNAVIGFSQIIESEMFGKVENPQYLDYVRHIQESGYDLLVKIEDLLEIANIEAGRVALVREDVYIRDMLKQVLDTQAHHAVSAKIGMEVAPSAADAQLFADRLKLQHILGHLVANAMRFSHDGGRVTISAALTAAGEAEICVRDSGIGMTDVKRAAILAAMQEDNCWTTGHNRVIGLGLALTREFVTMHGGQVDIASKPGEGTMVRIVLPKECVRAVKQQNYLQAVS